MLLFSPQFFEHWVASCGNRPTNAIQNSFRFESRSLAPGLESPNELPNISRIRDKAFLKRISAKYSSLRQTIFYQRVQYVFPYRFWLVISAEDYAEMSDTRVVREINNIVDDDAAKVRAITLCNCWVSHRGNY